MTASTSSSRFATCDGQFRGFRCIQRLERNFCHTHGGAQMQQEGAQRMVRRQFFLAGAPDDEQSCRGVEAQQKMQPFQRFLIAPLQVIDQQE